MALKAVSKSWQVTFGHRMKPNQAELVHFQTNWFTPFFWSWERQVKDPVQSQQIAAGVRLRVDECLWAHNWLPRRKGENSRGQVEREGGCQREKEKLVCSESVHRQYGYSTMWLKSLTCIATRSASVVSMVAFVLSFFRSVISCILTVTHSHIKEPQPSTADHCSIKALSAGITEVLF